MSNVQNPSNQTTIREWNEALQRKIQGGSNRMAAIKTLVQEDPELHGRYLQAYNEINHKLASVSPSIKHAAKVAAGVSAGGDIFPNAIAQWNQAIDAKVKAGKSRTQAISDLVNENPDLHSAYLQAFNKDHKSRPR